MSGNRLQLTRTIRTASGLGLHPAIETADAIIAEGWELAPKSAQAVSLPDPETVARLFHEAYERLAPRYKYSTRVATAVPWDDVPIDNKSLMIATATAVLAALSTQPAARAGDGSSERGAAVSYDGDEARAEAARRFLPDGEKITWAAANTAAGFKEGAEWQATRSITEAQIEAAAKALMRGVVDGLPDWIDDLTEQIREYWRDEARTALEAARGVQS